jgi:hypothetical protein
MERKRIPRSIAKKMTGHRTESVYIRYDITSDSEMEMGRDMIEHHSRIIVDAREAE